MTILNGRFREYKLDNGLVVALQDTPTQTIAGVLRVNFGPVHEKKGEEGLAHFLEHCLVTGGSRKYSPEESDRFRGNLGYHNAITSLGRIVFYSMMLPEDFEKWLEFISDSAFYPRFDANMVDGERGRVLREFADTKSAPEFRMNKALTTAFCRGHPTGIFKLGKESVVSNANGSNLRTFHSRGFHPNNMDLLIAGALPPETTDFIEKYFASKNPGQNTRIDFPKLLPLDDKVIIHESAPDLYNEESPQESSAMINLCFVCPPDSSREIYPVRILSQILGVGGSSRLFRRLGLEMGLAYEINTSCNGEYNRGVFEIDGSVPSKRLKEAIDNIFLELQKVREEGISELELSRAKKLAKYSVASNYDSNEGHINAMALRLDNGISPEELLDNYASVTLDDVVQVARKYFPRDRETGKYVLGIRDPLKKD